MDVKGRKGWVDPFRFNEQQEEQDPHRKKYRTPKRDIVTKAYTINQESKYLTVKNVHSLGAEKDLIKMFAIYGPIEEYRAIYDDENQEKFTESYWIKYKEIWGALEAKRKTDNFPFLGKLLEVNYAPQYETLTGTFIYCLKMIDTREKINERRKAIRQMTKDNYYDEISKQKQVPTPKKIEVLDFPDPLLVPFTPVYTDKMPLQSLQSTVSNRNSESKQTDSNSTKIPNTQQINSNSKKRPNEEEKDPKAMNPPNLPQIKRKRI